jgi:hypothetical protein
MDRVTKLGGRFLLTSQELKGAWEIANESMVLEDVISLMKRPLSMVSPSKRVCLPLVVMVLAPNGECT